MQIDNDLLEFARQTLPEWSLEGAQIEPITVSENVTFRVDKDGLSYVLRIHRSWYHTLEELESGLIWTDALRASGIDVPEPLLTTGGKGFVTRTLPGTLESRNIGALKWVEGDVLAEVIRRDANDTDALCRYFRQLGAIAASIHAQATDWNAPPNFKRHAFDAAGLVGEHPFWGRFWEIPQLRPEQADLLRQGREVIADTLDRYGQPQETYSLIHADLHMHNLVLSSHGLHIIDFDDAGFGWHQFDLAVALHEYVEHKAYPEILAALLEGYRAHRSFDSEAAKLIPLFLLVRSVMALGWVHQRPELGKEKYIPEMIEHACRHVRRFLDA